jgi:L-asparaginase
MVPYALSNSDAVFNLGGGIVAAQVLPPGVYVVMNGRVFPWHSVIKVKERGVFEAPQPSGGRNPQDG